VNQIRFAKQYCMEYGSLYFYTSTIHNWRPLIHQYNFYNTITDSLSFLHKKGLLKVYGFVIMPNHMHLIWQLLKQNGKESPVASLMKFTAHSFEQHIVQNNPNDLSNYIVNWRTRKYNFWQPEPDWFLLFKEKTTFQKLNYIHNNPLQKHWNLVNDPVNYMYSSAKFYETGLKEFDFLYHYLDYNDRLT
jgi:putative transposase